MHLPLLAKHRVESRILLAFLAVAGGVLAFGKAASEVIERQRVAFDHLAREAAEHHDQHEKRHSPEQQLQLVAIARARPGQLNYTSSGVGSINQGSFSIGALVVSLLGAIVLLAIVNLVRRGSPR